jgi:hypothetical protein
VRGVERPARRCRLTRVRHTDPGVDPAAASRRELGALASDSGATSPNAGGSTSKPHCPASRQARSSVATSPARRGPRAGSCQ